MSRIRSVNTRPELALRSALWRRGLRFRLHDKRVSGRPDLIFQRARVVVFVDGCFWHGCPDHYVPPRSRQDYWAEKLAGNVIRDLQRVEELARLGWRVLRVRECQVEEDLNRVVETIIGALSSAQWISPASWRAVRVVQLAGDEEIRHLIDLAGRHEPRTERRPRSFIRQGRRSRAVLPTT